MGSATAVIDQTENGARDLSPAQLYRDLTARAEMIREGAIKELTATAESAVKSLENDFGIICQLVVNVKHVRRGRAPKTTDTTTESTTPITAAPNGASATSREKSGTCKVCGFSTIPAHDGRSHRREINPQKPFNDKQLATRGFVKQISK